MHALPPDLCGRLIDDLSRQNYSVIPNAIPAPLITQLREEFTSHSERFRPAKVGRSAEASTQLTIRNDSILWINSGDLLGGEAQLFKLLEHLRVQLNRTLYLGLTHFEAHYARYDEGHFYQRHVDRFQTDDARTISFVLYLNSGWKDSDGGHLRLHVTPPVDVVPEAGTLVCFTSADIEHEVLPAHRERMSIAAWFRRDGVFMT